MIVRRAYAKVNLALAVGPPIPSPAPFAGYHPICSWMASVDLFDEVRVTRFSDGGATSTHVIEWDASAPRPSEIDWPLEKDLAVRAHRLLENEVGRPLPVSMHVAKRVPVGGGLGGGSADAAAALMALRELFGLDIPRPRLATLAGTLGSDVAYFIDDGGGAASPALVSHLGERIERVARVPQALVLIFPPFGCPTGAVYREFDGKAAGEGFEQRAAAVGRLVKDAAGRGHVLTDELFNDLAAPACRAEPRLREIIDRLAGELNARVHVTGSGSTLFVLAESDDQAGELAERAPRAIPGIAAVATRLV